MDLKFLVPALFVAESIFLIYMALQPGYAVPTFHFPFFRGGDFEHFLAYLVYGILGYATFSPRLGQARGLALSLVFCGLFAGLTEGMQAFVPTRFADPTDWVVDVLGSSAGILAWRRDVLLRKLRFQKAGPF
jgi:VanZ family protein